MLVVDHRFNFHLFSSVRALATDIKQKEIFAV